MAAVVKQGRVGGPVACAGCGHDNSPQAKFCEECGAPLPRRCTGCGGPLSPTAKFCPECGRTTTATPPPTIPAPPAVSARFASPDSYTPKHLAERILLSRSALEGERKHITVLFADLKGSMELVGARDPEEARTLLDAVVERMMEAVHFYEGTVNQVMGDGIMALFGAPLACEDHALRACYAGLRMQDSVRRFAEEREAAGELPVQIRVGLNSGDVVVRSVGSDLRTDYSAIGHTTNVAARMEQLATPGSILLAPATFDLVDEFVRVDPQGRVSVKGLAEPIDVYALVGTQPARSRLQARAARGLSAFAGRGAEMAELTTALERAQRGHGQIVGVIADPGVGKSRLCNEFAQSSAAQGCRIVQTGCISYRKTTAYLPVIELLRTYFQIEPRDDVDGIREKVAGRLRALDLALEPFRPAFLWLLDAPDDDAQWRALDPAQRRRALVDGVKRLLLRESSVQPLILLVEDLHWIDAETQTLLDSLVESLPRSRVLLLVNYRPEYQHAWGGRSYYRQVRLEPLADEPAEELLQTLLGADAGLRALKHLLIARTQGNPLFIEETVRTLRDTGVLVGEPGRYRVTQAIDAIRVPPTVQTILTARIDRLPDQEKRLLQSAAVIGTEVSFDLLREIAEVPEDELRRGLVHLQAAELLYESCLFPQLEYSFRHALTHDVAYGSVLQDRRRALHARIVEAIERLFPARLTEHVERLAHHAFRGEVWARAVGYLRQAGARAQGRSAHPEAVTWFEQALTALARLPRTRETDEQAIDLRFDLRASLYPLGAFDRIRARLAEAEELAGAIGDQRRMGWVALHTGDYLRQVGRFTEACQHDERARSIAEAVQDGALQRVARHYLALARYALGDVREAAALLRAVLEGADGGSAGTGFRLTQSGTQAGFLAVNHAWLARSLAERGAFAEAFAAARQGLAIATELDAPYSVVATTFALGSVHAARGDVDEALVLLERSQSTARDWNITLYECHAMRVLGWVYALGGRCDQGLALLEDAAALVASRSLAFQEATVMAVLAEVAAMAGQHDRARSAADAARALARERGQRADEATALAALGQFAGHRNDLAAAQAHYRSALDLAAELALRPFAARCHLGLSDACARAGERERAQDHLASAAALLADMEMTLWLRRVPAQLCELDSLAVVARERADLHERLRSAVPPDDAWRVVLDRRSGQANGRPPRERRRPSAETPDGRGLIVTSATGARSGSAA